jgi:hypothetical protein
MRAGMRESKDGKQAFVHLGLWPARGQVRASAEEDWGSECGAHEWNRVTSPCHLGDEADAEICMQRCVSISKERLSAVAGGATRV